MSDKQHGQRIIPWLYIVVGIDIFLVLISASIHSDAYYPGKSYLVTPFNLGYEMNLAVWWSGICLVIAGMLAYELFSVDSNATRYAWLALSILLMGLSLDEVGALHERASGWLELLPYGVVCCLMFLYAIYKLYGDAQTRKSAILIFVAFSLYGSVVLQEFIEHLVDWPEWALGLRVGVEEGTELLATLLLFYSMVPHRGLQSHSLRAIIPRPDLARYLPGLVLAGLILSVISILIFPQLMGKAKAGHPLVWYPMVLFFILSCMSFWMYRESEEDKCFWSGLAIIFILCSAGTMWNLLSFIPVIGDDLPAKALSYLLYGLSVLMIAGWIHRKSAASVREVAVLLLLSVLILGISLVFYYQHRSIPFGAWSVVSGFYGMFIFFAVIKIMATGSRTPSGNLAR